MLLCVVVDKVMDFIFFVDDLKLVFFVVCELWVYLYIREDLEIF